ncbi:enoyl-CoA hydratase/isomerase family protein [Myxococcota bacterium]|nr:enoyl-CoA hydratase/isomerase family protein [Myxococcota bacterium]
MSESPVSVERNGSVATLWLDRPERRNALDTATLEALIQRVAELEHDFELKVLILAGRGKDFCSGADRTSPPGVSAGMEGRERRFASQLGRRAARALEDLEVVTIARVHGHAIGGGCVLALACDFRIAEEGAVFSLPEVDLGLPLTWGALPRLAAEIGAARAREMILMCEPVDAPLACQWGLVHRVVPESDLGTEVDRWADRIASKPEMAVHMTKTQFRSLARRSGLGDITESDGDLLTGAARGDVARRSFS